MRLEILVDSEEPVIYPLNKPEIVIGGGEACDIILGSAGISRKHVKVIVDKDSYFVIDQGSTNGTFINEERLVPGRRTEFTSFFPVRLGSRVLLTLLSDEEAHDSVMKEFSIPVPQSGVGNESTRVLSLKDVQASSTKKLVSNRQAVVAKKKVAPAVQKRKKKEIQDSSRMGRTVFIVLLLIGGAYYYNNFMNQDAANVAPVVPVKPTKILSIDKPEEIKEKVVDFKIQSEELITREKLTNVFGDLKCLIPDEIYFCDKIPALKEGNSGVASLGTSLIFLVEQTPWFAEALKTKESYLKFNTSGSGVVPEAELNVSVAKLAFFEFLKTAILPIDLKDYTEKSFYVVFYTESEQALAINRVFAVKTEVIPDLLKNYTADRLQKYQQYGPSVLNEFEIYYHNY